MTAAESIERESGLPTDYYAPDYLVEVDGRALDAEAKGDVLDLKVTLSHQEIASFELTVNNWDDRNFGFKYSDTDTFDLGREVHVQLGYADRMVSVFRGIVTRLSPKFPESGPPTLSITCHDKLVKLKNRHPADGENHRYVNMRDWQIAQEIATRNQLGFQATEDGPLHAEVWQQNLDDASFLMQRAARIDFDCSIRTNPDTGEDVLHFVQPTDGRAGSARQVYVLEWGKSLSSFTPELATMDQVGRVTVRGWDPMRREAITYTATAQDLGGEATDTSTSGPSTASDGPLGDRSEQVVDAPVRSEEEARRLAVSMLQERAYRFFKGTGNVVGLPDLEPGHNLDLLGLGERFSGTYYVEGVEHTLGESGFLTSFTVRRVFDGPVTSGSRSGTAGGTR
jgi:phage protein D